MAILGTVTAAGGATAVCADGTRVTERPLQPGDEISLNQVIRTSEDGVLAIQLADGGQLEIRGGRELSLSERVLARLSPSDTQQAAAEDQETDPEIEAMQQALLAGEDPSELEAAAAGGAQSEGGSSFVIIQRNGLRTLIELNGLDTDSAVRKLFEELGEDAILAVLEELGIPVLSISLSEDDDSGRSAEGTEGTVEFDGRGVFGSLLFDPESGAFTYVLSDEGKAALNLLGVNPDGQPDSVTEIFQFTLIDADGNRTAAVVAVTVNGVDDPLLISNFLPVAEGDYNALVDEADLPAADATGSFDLSVPDGFGVLRIAGNDISLDELLASSESPVEVFTPNGSLLTITGYDGLLPGGFTGGTVHYRYQLGAAQDHGAGDSITEELQILLVDDDGDMQEATLLVAISDDAPELTGETIELFADESPASTDNLADATGADQPGTLTFDGNGFFGTLTRVGDAWIYTLNAAGEAAASLLSVDEDGVPESIRESFTYTITDSDGDPRSATVMVTVLGVDDPVQATGAVVVVDEGDLPDGTHTVGAAVDAHDAGVTAMGSITLTTPDGLSTVKIGDTVLDVGDLLSSSEDSPMPVDGGEYGFLQIIGFEGVTSGPDNLYISGTVYFSYTLTRAIAHDDPELNQLGDAYPVVLTDRDGSTHSSASITAEVIDDAPVLGAVRHGVISGEPGVLESAIDLQLGADGLDGAIGISLLSGLPEGARVLPLETHDGYSILTVVAAGESGDEPLFTLTVREDGTYRFELLQGQGTSSQAIDAKDLSVSAINSGQQDGSFRLATTTGDETGDPLVNPVTFSTGSGTRLSASGEGIGAGNNHLDASDSLILTWDRPVTDVTFSFNRIDDYQGDQAGRETLSFTVLVQGVVVATGLWVPPVTGAADFAYDPDTALALLGAENYQTFNGWDGSSFDAVSVTVHDDSGTTDDDSGRFNLVGFSTTELVTAEDLELSFETSFPATDDEPVVARIDVDVSAEGSVEAGFTLRTDGDPETVQFMQGSTADDMIYIGDGDQADGADGFDTVIVDGTFDVAQIRNIEALSSADGQADDVFQLSENDVLNFTDGDNVLRILGDVGDQLQLDPADAWQKGATVEGFTTYTSNLATLEVQSGIEVRVADDPASPS